MSQLTVGNQFPLEQIVFSAASDPMPVLIYNSDAAVTVYLAYANNALVTDAAKVTPLLPQSSVGFDGTRDVYATTGDSSKTAVLNVYPSGTQYSQTAGITQLVKMGSLRSNPPAGSFGPVTPLTVMNLVDVTEFASYDLSMYCWNVSPGAALAPITSQINLQWFNDKTSGIPVFQETWYIWNGRTIPADAFSATTGCGPMHGRYMTVTLLVPVSSDSNVVLQYLNLYGSNRSVPYSDWRQNGQGVNPQMQGFTIQQGGGTGYDNILASMSGVTLAPGTLCFVPLGLFAGPVFYRYQAGGSVVPAHDPVIAEVAATIGGQWAAGTSMTGVLVNFPTDNLEHEGQAIFPRSPTVFIIQSGASPLTFSLEVSAQQAA